MSLQQASLASANVPLMGDGAIKASAPADSKGSTGQAAFTGAWLPLLSDKFRNNVAFRPALLLLYMVGASFICLILILSFTFAQSTDWISGFDITPPATVHLGAPVTFSFKVVSAVSEEGIAGVVVVASLIPMTTVHLDVTTKNGVLRSASISCLKSMLSLNSATQQRDVVFCSPGDVLEADLLEGNYAITDSDGFANFTDMSLNHGAAGQYLLTVMPLGKPHLYDSFVVNVVAAPLDIVLSNVPSIFNDSTVPVGLYNATSAWSLTATVSWLPLGDNGYVTACAVILPLNMQDANGENFPGVIESPSDTVQKAVTLVNHTSCTDVIREEVVDLDDGTSYTRLTAEITFTNVFVTSCNSKQVYLGVSSMGMIVPIAYSVANLYPSELYLSNTPISNVDSVIISLTRTAATSGSNGVWSVVEGDALQSLSVAVSDSAGTPLAGRQVYLHLEVDPSKNAAGAARAAAALTPFVTPKILLHDAHTTNALGVASFSSTAFSVFGACGTYILTAVCDGVAITQVNASSADGTSSITSGPLVVNVTTRVGSVSITGLNSNTREGVGKSWSNVPRVTIRDAAGRAIPGKYAVVQPLSAEDQQRYATVSSSLPSTDNGTVFFRFIRTYTVPVPAAASPTNGVVLFGVFVDSVAQVTFSKKFVVSARSYSDAERQKCAWVDISPAPTVPQLFTSAYRGRSSALVLTARNVFGQPVNASVNLTIDLTTAWDYETLDLRPPPSTSLVVYTSDDGTYVAETADAASGPLLTGRVFCGAVRLDVDTTSGGGRPSLPSGVDVPLVHPNYVSLFRQRRGVPNVLMFPDAGDVNVTVAVSVTAESQVSPAQPIAISGKVVGYPSDVAVFAAADVVMSTAYISTASAGSAVVVITLARTDGSTYVVPGYYVVVVTVDKAVSEIVMIFFILPKYLTMEIVVPAAVGDSSDAPDVSSSSASESSISSTGGSATPTGAEAFLTQPVIRLVGGDCADVIVYAQLGLLSESDGSEAVESVQFLNPSVDSSDVLLAQLWDFTQQTARVSAVADPVTCLVNFTGLGITAAAPNLTFILRYCMYAEYCVSESRANNFSTSSVSDVMFVTVSEDIAGVGGQLLPEITVYAVDNDYYLIESTFACIPTLAAPAASTFLVIEGGSSTGGLFTAAPSTGYVTFPRGALRLSSSIPEGAYQLTVQCTGGALETPIELAVLSEVSSIRAVYDTTSEVTPGTIAEVLVTAVSPAGVPVPGIEMQFSVKNNMPARFCTGYACGLLHPASALYDVTDEAGTASLFMIVQSAATTSLSVTVGVAKSTDATKLVKQLVFRQYAAVARLMGLPSDEASVQIVRQEPRLADVVTIVNSFMKADMSVIGVNTEFLLPGTYIAYSNALYCSSGVLNVAVNAFNDSAAGQAVTNATGVSPLDIAASLAKVAAEHGLDSSLDSIAQRQVAFNKRFSVVNDVVNATVERNIRIPPLQIEVNVQNLNAVLTSQFVAGLALPTVFHTVEGEDCPIVVFFDSSGAPVVGSPFVFVDVIPFGSAIAASVGGVAATATNGLLLCPIYITSRDPGTFQLRVSVQGGAATTLSTRFTVSTAPLLNRNQVMQYIAGFLVVFFSPMLMATVPHARPVVVLFGLLVSGATVYVSVFVQYNVPADGVPYYTNYCWYIVALSSLLAAVNVAVASIQLAGRRKVSLRIMNDEDRALNVVRYTTWLLHVRIADQADERLLLLKKEEEAMPGALLRRLATKVEDVMLALNAKVGKKVFNESAIKKARSDRTVRHRQSKPALLYNKAEAFEPIRTPINFLIVVAISIVLLITATFAIVSRFISTYNTLSGLKAKIPDIGKNPADAGGTSAELFRCVTEIIIDLLDEGVKLIVKKAPGIGKKIAPLLNAVRQTDMWVFFSDARAYVIQAVENLQICFWVAGAISTLVYVATLFFTWQSIPQIVRASWRGQRKDDKPAVAPLDAYIGLHCLQMAIAYVFVFVVVLLLVNIPLMFFFMIEPFRNFILTTVLAAFLTSISTVVVNMFLQKVFVSRFLVNGDFTVVRPELYAMWHFVGLILGIFSSLVKGVVRWVKSVLFVTLMFGRADVPIFPGPFGASDPVHKGFVGMVVIEARNSNPHYLMFSSLLLADRHLHIVARTSVFFKMDDLFLSEDHNISAGIKNIVRIILRKRCGSKTSLSLREPFASASAQLELSHYRQWNDFIRRERVKQRLWLWFLLTKNPSLRQDRKHRLFATLKEIAAQETASGSLGSLALSPSRLLEKKVEASGANHRVSAALFEETNKATVSGHKRTVENERTSVELQPLNKNSGELSRATTKQNQVAPDDIDVDL